MSIKQYKSIICLRPKDETTEFLNPIGELFGRNYHIVDDDDLSHDRVIELIKETEPTSLILFLGHGRSSALYSAETSNYKQRDFIKIEHNNLFKDHNVFLLACRSEQFISRLKGYKNIIGFGNIISSRNEIMQEAESTGEFRDLEDSDIRLFNEMYVGAIDNAFRLVLADKIKFNQLYTYISFFINKNINSILRQASNPNKLELASLLFEFRNEMKYLKN